MLCWFRGKLRETEKYLETVQKQLDKQVSIGSKIQASESKNDQEKLQQIQDSLKAVKCDLEKAEIEIKELTKEDDPATKDFDTRKPVALEMFNTIKKSIDDFLSSCQQPEETAPSHHGDINGDDSGDEPDSSMSRFIALKEWKGEEPGDLSFKKNEILVILKWKSNGWWKAKNANGQEGLVPNTLLKVYAETEL